MTPTTSSPATGAPTRDDADPAAAVPLIPREVLFGNPSTIGPQISPDGSRLAWVAPYRGVLNVWVRHLPNGRSSRDHDGSTGGGDRVVTNDSGRGITTYGWSPDGARILYVKDCDGDEDWHLYDVDLTSGETRDLTPFAGVQARLCKISKRRPGEVLVALNRDNPSLHDVYRLDLATGELTKVVENPGFLGFVADEDLNVRAALVPTPDSGMAIMARDDDASPWRPLLVVGYEDAMSTGPVRISEDGTWLLCMTSEGANTTRLVWLDMAAGEREVVAADPVYDVGAVWAHPDSGEPQVVWFQRDRCESIVLDPDIADDMAVLTGLDGGAGDLMLLNTDTDYATLLVAVVHDNAPIRYYTYHRPSRKASFLFAHKPDLEQYALAGMEPFTVQSRDGLELHGYLTFPPGLDRRDLPAVLVPHGGPWTRDGWGYDAEAQWLANRGYVCIQVNFRGSAGYGKEFLNAGNREWGGRMHDDLLDAVGWVVAQGWVDPARIGIYGGSYGGYAALIGVAFTPGLFACAIAAAAPVNLNTLIASFPPYWAPIIAQAKARIGDPDTEPEFLWSRSPLSRVDDIRSPLLLAQGANDVRVKTAESEQIVAALTQRGIPHRYLLIEGEGHGFVKPENRLRFYRAAEIFLAQHLGGRAEDTPDDDPPRTPDPTTPHGPDMTVVDLAPL